MNKLVNYLVDQTVPFSKLKRLDYIIRNINTLLALAFEASMQESHGPLTAKL